jgi:tRNA A-37 threonylcarbamoyl transferase component Bud32/DNA-directed RNA polymerase subunit RPC12/RpoP
VAGEQVFLTDCESQLGTYVNDARISRHELHPGDIIRIGDTRLRLDVEDVATAATVANVGALLARVAPAGPERLAELVGTTLGPYEVGEVLARGQSSVVFRARDTRDRREVALKVLRPEVWKTEAEALRLIQAVGPLLPLRHPNLVAVYAAEKVGGHCLFALEYVEGETLSRMLERVDQAGIGGLLDWQHALRVALHVARGLQHLHEHQVVHRLVVPRNILVGRADKIARLTGLVWARAAGWNQPISGGKPEELLRDLPYLAPERARGDTLGGPRSDIYGLGATLYALLMGRPPFDGKTTPEVLTQIFQSTPRRPRDIQVSLPESFERTVLRMLAKRPEDRYPSVAQLLVDLERVAGGPGTAAGEAPGLGPQVVDGKIRVSCECGQQLQAREKYAGTQVRCPACGALLLLPGKPSLGQTPEPLAAPGPGPHRLNGHGASPATAGPAQRGFAFLVVLLVVILAVVAAAMFLPGLLWRGGVPSTPADSRRSTQGASPELPSTAR